MAFIIDNTATEGLSGKLGNIVYNRRKADGVIIVSKRKVKNKTKATTEQQKVRSKFEMASAYAKGALALPATLAYYKSKTDAGQTAYNMAMSDYLTPPIIEEIDISAYKGVIGNTIRVRATDKFKVTSVHVVISNTDGTLVEEADAVKQTNGIDWLFTAKKANATLTGDKISVTATDMPLNKTVLEKTL